MTHFPGQLYNKIAQLFKSKRSRATTVAFGNIPSAPAGATLVYPEQHATRMRHLLHGMMQASVLDQPGSVFLVGLEEAEIMALYPTAQRLSATEKVGRVAMTPSCAMTLVRILFGTNRLADHLHELIYLEQAGTEMHKPGPLAMIPDWAREQLTPASLYRLLANPQRSDATVGSAFKALFHHPDFSFAMLDAFREASGEQGVTAPHEKTLKLWETRAQSVVAALCELIDHPPVALQLMPAVRDAQDAATPSVWYVHPEDLPEIAPILDAMVLSHGLRHRHHWYVDAAAVGKAAPTGLNALERLSVALWQHRAACENGHGPALWCDLGGEPAEIQGARDFKHRAIQGCSMVIGDETSVMNSVIRTLSVDPDAFDWQMKEGRPGMFFPKLGQFRHWKEIEIAAVQQHVGGATPAPAPAPHPRRKRAYPL